MIVDLYTNTSENNTINKTKSYIDSKNCILKQDCSIMYPTIILDYDSGDINDTNYVYIPDLERYYFVKEIKLLTAHRYMLSCEVDVLESFKSDILHLQCIINKQQDVSKGNMYYNDGSYVSLVNEYTQVYNFPYGFDDNGHFILVCAGG